MRTTLLFCCLNFSFGSMFAQFGGNINYQDKYYNNNNREGQHNYLASDSTLIINVSILLNQKADSYMLTLGVNEEQKTPKECIAAINSRIDAFLSKAKSMGIKNEAIFVDFISQSKVYDYEMNKLKDNSAEQQEKGFEVKKNVIIRTTDYDMIEKIIIAAADSKIYDIVKLDYITDNIEAVYERMMQEAKAILDRKKNSYTSMFNCKVAAESAVSDNFSYVFPKDQYRKYQAAESPDVEAYSLSFVKKVARKNTTFYYEGLSYSGYDKVINNSNPEVGIQYVLNLYVQYKKLKNK